jgi:UDP-glucose-4-epimerase GalE
MVRENVLVTGGAGYIGSHTCKLLYEKGYQPVVFDNLSTGHMDFVKWGPIEVGDLLDKAAVKRVFSRYSFKSVFHFAAKAYVEESIKNPLDYYYSNIVGSMNLIDEFLANYGENFIFSSSCATYGESLSELIEENHVQNPINPYGFTKLAIEKLLMAESQNRRFNYAVLRYFNAAGADPSCEIGEKHYPETHVIPLLVRAIRKNEVFRVNGNNFNTPDGTAVRDFVHVSDLALAHVLALVHINNNSESLVLNVGTGKGISIGDLINSAKDYDVNLRVEYKPKRKGDPAKLIADKSRIEKILHWQPLLSSTDIIFKSAYDWYVQNND